MIAFDWSRTSVSEDREGAWLEVPFTDDSPVHERVALIAVVAAMEAEERGRSWEAIEVGRRVVRARAASGDDIERDELERYLGEAAEQVARAIEEAARSAKMASDAAHRRFVEAQAEAGRIGDHLRGSSGAEPGR